MRTAIVALAWAQLACFALVALSAFLGWLAGRKSDAERTSTVARVEGYRERLAKDQARARVERILKEKRAPRRPPNGGNDAA